MSSQNRESHSAEDHTSDLELNKETLQDLDLEPADASEVKGGAMSTLISTGRTGGGGGGGGGGGASLDRGGASRVP